MSQSPLSQQAVVAVVGTGAMGAGIAQVAALAGHVVKLLDNRPGAAAKAVDGIRAQFAKLAEKGKISAETAQAAGDAPRAPRRAKAIIVLRFILRFLLSLIKRQETERRQGQRPAGRNRMKSTCLF